MDSLQRRNFLVLDPQWADLLARCFAEIDRAVFNHERPRLDTPRRKRKYHGNERSRGATTNSGSGPAAA